jgi:hypothetical protein
MYIREPPPPPLPPKAPVARARTPQSAVSGLFLSFFPFFFLLSLFSFAQEVRSRRGKMFWAAGEEAHAGHVIRSPYLR